MQAKSTTNLPNPDKFFCVSASGGYFPIHPNPSIPSCTPRQPFINFPCGGHIFPTIGLNFRTPEVLDILPDLRAVHAIGFNRDIKSGTKVFKTDAVAPSGETGHCIEDPTAVVAFVLAQIKIRTYSIYYRPLIQKPDVKRYHVMTDYLELRINTKCVKSGSGTRCFWFQSFVR